MHKFERMKLADEVLMLVPGDESLRVETVNESTDTYVCKRYYNNCKPLHKSHI